METLIAVLAKDWSHYGGQVARDQPFDLISGWVAGLLVSEDDEKIVIAHEVFPTENEVRHTTVVQKREVIEDLRFTIQEREDPKMFPMKGKKTPAGKKPSKMPAGKGKMKAPTCENCGKEYGKGADKCKCKK